LRKSYLDGRQLPLPLAGDQSRGAGVRIAHVTPFGGNDALIFLVSAVRKVPDCRPDRRPARRQKTALIIIEVAIFHRGLARRLPWISTLAQQTSLVAADDVGGWEVLGVDNRQTMGAPRLLELIGPPKLAMNSRGNDEDLDGVDVA
jgi:hypothetical protein